MNLSGRAVEAGDTAGHADAIERLHKLIYHGAGNEFLRRQVLEIRARLSAYRPITFERRGG